MELKLQRTSLDATCTQGELSDGTDFWYTLELPVKDGLPGSAIPPGKYLIMLAPSPKFLKSSDEWVQKYAGTIPHLMGIPGRSNILVHFGNTAVDTAGCILVGKSLAADFIGSSRSAFEELHAKLVTAQAAGEVLSIEVIGGIPEQPLLHPDLSTQV